MRVTGGRRSELDLCFLSGVALSTELEDVGKDVRWEGYGFGLIVGFLLVFGISFVSFGENGGILERTFNNIE